MWQCGNTETPHGTVPTQHLPVCIGAMWTHILLVLFFMLSSPVLYFLHVQVKAPNALTKLSASGDHGCSRSWWYNALFQPGFTSRTSSLPHSVSPSGLFLSQSLEEEVLFFIITAFESWITAAPIVWVATLTRSDSTVPHRANKAHKGLPLWSNQLGFIRCCTAPASLGCSERS